MYFTKDFLLSSDSVSLDLLNQPVHILDDNLNLSPSAFIPFCSFDGNSDLLGRETGKFSLPVCTSFKKRLLDGQLCYQIDVSRVINEMTVTGLQKGGLTLLVDVNPENNLISMLNTTPEDEIFSDFIEEIFDS